MKCKSSKDPSVKLLKFADDTTLIGLIQDGDEPAYRRLRNWLSGAVLTTWSLKRSKRGDDRGLQEKPPCSPPLTIMNSTVTAVESFRLLGTAISQDPKLDNHIESLVKAEAVLPSPAEEVQPATGAADTNCHH